MVNVPVLPLPTVKSVSNRSELFTDPWYRYFRAFHSTVQNILVGTTPPAFAGEYINVKRDYGAKGDGITDDTTAINNALTAASQTGRAVYFPGSALNGVPVPYMVSTITVPGWTGAAQTQTRIIGDGYTSQIKQIASAAAAHILILGNSAFTQQIADISIENISFASAVAKSSGAAIISYNCSRLNIDRVYMLDANMQFGIYVLGVDNVTIRRVFILDSLNTGMTFASNGTTIPGAGLYIDETCVIAKTNHTGGSCINLSGGIGGAFINALCFGGTQGLLIDRTVFNVTNREVWCGQEFTADHTGNYGIYAATSALEFLSCNGCTFGGNVVDIFINNLGTPPAPANPVPHIGIHDCWFAGSSATNAVAIYYNDGGDLIIDGCQVAYYASDGLQLQPQATARIVVSNNIIHNNGGYGIDGIAFAPQEAVFSGNILKSNTLGSAVGITPSNSVKALGNAGDTNSPIVGTINLHSYSKAAMPSAVPVGMLIYVSDDVGGAVPAFSDGASWRRVTDRNVIA